MVNLEALSLFKEETVRLPFIFCVAVTRALRVPGPSPGQPSVLSHMADLCGPTLEHLTVIDESLITEFDLRPNTFCISGPRGNGFWVRFLDGGPWAIPWEGRPFGLGNSSGCQS